MDKYYSQAIQKMRELGNISKKEWDKIAKEEGYLSSESLQFITKMQFNKIKRKIKQGVI